jgi:hypothetical protein
MTKYMFHLTAEPIDIGLRHRMVILLSSYVFLSWLTPMAAGRVSRAGNGHLPIAAVPNY